MALESLGLAASLLSMAGAADAAFRCSLSVYRVARRVKAARKEIKDFGRDIEAFYSIVDSAHNSLNRHCSKLLLSQVLQDMEERDVFAHLAAKSSRIVENIKVVLPKIKSLRSEFRLATKLKWVTRKFEVQALRYDMESLKSSLDIVISMLCLEAVSKDDDPTSQREIKRLQRLIVNQVEENQRLREKIQGQSHPFGTMDQLYDDSVGDGVAMEEVIANLGTMMVENTRTQESLRSSRRLRRRRSSGNMRHSYPREPDRHRRPNQNTPTHRQEPQFERTIEEETERTSTQHPRQEISPTIPQQPSSSVYTTSPLKLEQVEIPRTQPSLPENHNITEGDFTSVRETSYLLHLKRSNDLQSILGYIANSNGIGYTQVTALLDPELPQNVISLAKVASLNLIMDPPDEDEKETWIYFPQGERRKGVGRVTFLWSFKDILPKKRAISVHCCVYEHDIRDVILGSPFLSKTEYYRSNSQGST